MGTSHQSPPIEGTPRPALTERAVEDLRPAVKAGPCRPLRVGAIEFQRERPHHAFLDVYIPV